MDQSEVGRLLWVEEAIILITKPGKTSSGSWIWGFRSTINGSPHLSLIVWSVSPSPTTYISSQGRQVTKFPLNDLPWSPEEEEVSLMDPIKIRPNSPTAQYHETTSIRGREDDEYCGRLLLGIETPGMLVVDRKWTEFWSIKWNRELGRWEIKKYWVFIKWLIKKREEFEVWRLGR